MIAYFTAFWISYMIARLTFNLVLVPVLDYCFDTIREKYYMYKTTRQLKEATRAYN